MNQETFKRILTEEGIDNANLRVALWHSHPPDLDDDEDRLRKISKKFKKQLPEILALLWRLNRHAINPEDAKEQ